MPMRSTVESKIDKIYDLTQENCKQIAVLIEHVKTQNGRIGRVESNYEGVTGTMTEHDETLHDLCSWKETMKLGQVRFDKKMMIIYGGGVTFVYSVILFALKVFTGI